MINSKAQTSHIKDGMSKEKNVAIAGHQASTSIVERYHEALKMKSSDFVILHKNKRVPFESEDSSSCRSESSNTFRITPAFLPADDSTVIYGYYLEVNSEAKEDYDYQTTLPNIEDFEFIDLCNTSGKGIMIPVQPGNMESGRKNNKWSSSKVIHKRKKHMSRNSDRIIPTDDGNAEPSENITVYASIGGTIKKDQVRKVIASSKKADSVYMGALAVKTNIVNSILKFYFDRDLHMTTNSLLKDKEHRRVFIKLCI